MPRLLRLLHDVRRIVLVHRRGLAALCAGVAALFALQALRPPPMDTVPVWTATRDLAGGRVVEAGDLTRTEYPAPLAPDYGVTDRADIVGRTLAIPVEQGEPMSSRKLVGSSALAGHPGRVAVAVRISDPDLVRLLRSGERVDLLAADPRAGGPAVRVATGAVVLAGAQPPREELLGEARGALVVLAVVRGEVEELVAAAAARYLTAVWDR